MNYLLGDGQPITSNFVFQALCVKQESESPCAKQVSDSPPIKQVSESPCAKQVSESPSIKQVLESVSTEQDNCELWECCLGESLLNNECSFEESGGKPVVKPLAQNVSEVPVDASVTINVNPVFSVGKVSEFPSQLIRLKVNGKNFDFEADTGASVSIMSQSMFDQNFSNLVLSPVPVQLCTIAGEIVVPGQVEVSVKGPQGKSHILPLIIFSR